MTTRADMAAALALSPVVPTNTYVIEAHADDPAGCLAELTGRVEPTEDAFLFRVSTQTGVYWVDQLDERVWRFHTDFEKRLCASIIARVGWQQTRPGLDVAAIRAPSPPVVQCDLTQVGRVG